MFDDFTYRILHICSILHLALDYCAEFSLHIIQLSSHSAVIEPRASSVLVSVPFKIPQGICLEAVSTAYRSIAARDYIFTISNGWAIDLPSNGRMISTT